MLGSSVVNYGTDSPSVESSSGGDAKYALCVGLNNYDMASWNNQGWRLSVLNGCVNDANYFRDNLVNRGGWPGANVTKLADSGATKTAIRNAIQNYANKAVPGDTFIYMHSSHALNHKNSSGNYTKDVALAAYAGPYEDFELASDLAKFASGVKVVVIVDACHSSGLFKSIEEVPSFDLAERVSSLIDEMKKEKIAKGKKDYVSKIAASEIGWVTAAEYNETSADGGFYDSDAWLTDWYYYGNIWGGAFLGAFTWGWWNGLADTTGVGDKDGYMDAYEGYKYAHSIVTSFNLSTPQYLNVSVLRSVELGISGGPGSAAPSNDNFANAARISGATGSTSGSNVGATCEAGEPLKSYRPAATNTVWWAWTAPSGGTATFCTTNTAFDTVMGVYAGTDVTRLTAIKEDDDGGPNNTSACIFDAVSGTTYYIAVSGYGASRQGTIKLYWNLVTSSGARRIWTVKYHKNDPEGGAYETRSQNIAVGETKRLLYLDSALKWAIKDEDGFSYIFLGWAKSPTGAAFYENGEQVCDLVDKGKVLHLYAVWQKRAYCVCFHSNDGRGLADWQEFRPNIAKNLFWLDSGLGWTRSGYDFLGWAKSPTSTAVVYANGQKVNNLMGIGEDLHLYAVWRDRRWTIRYHRNYSSTDNEYEDQKIPVGASVKLLWLDSQLGWTRGGYWFKGWAKSRTAGAAYQNGQTVKDLVPGGQVLHIYGAWGKKTN